MKIKVPNWLKRKESVDRGYRDHVGIAQRSSVSKNGTLYIPALNVSDYHASTIHLARNIGGGNKRYEQYRFYKMI